MLWDILPAGRQLGGAVANCAFRLHQLGNQVSFVSKVGEDSLGNEAIRILSEKGLNTSAIQVDTSRATGTVEVSISLQGNAEYAIRKNVAYDFIESGKKLLAPARAASAILFGNLIQRGACSKNTFYGLLEEAGPKPLKVVDINLRKDCYSHETVKQSL